MIDNNQFSTWTTGDELEFINGLGTHSDKRFNRRKLLEGYRKAMKFRPLSERYLDFRKIEFRLRELLGER